MGVPKFFRWMSERYPMCSNVIQENKIPEFDNLYLDMNGIIHSCSHPSDDVHFRLTEDQIFLSIFNYIDLLFTKIQPKKLFFLAIDGVAPRAKMNQQRARRFRTAKEAQEKRAAAAAKGETLPEEPPFDSNCITPGTVFMCKLSEQLKYFIAKKVTEDSSWQKIKIILSGHEVPGEGEHKIMEYIRLEKSKPEYHPNIRHCLYGLDADLIMLGLLTHEPHFCLLREEVSFGRSRKKNSTPETQNFYLMHLCLLREYLDFEFAGLRGTFKERYDLERVIDDFILLAFFVGNDFLPNLPGLHINEGALSLMFSLYKSVIVAAGKYLHHNGVMDLSSCQLLFDELSKYEKELFVQEFADSNWLKGKQTAVQSKVKRAPAPRITAEQQIYFEEIKQFALRGKSEENMRLGASLPQKNAAFAQKLCRELGLGIDTEDSNCVYWLEDEDEEDEESNDARARVIRKYDAAEIIGTAADSNQDEETQIQREFEQWKHSYYKEKLEFDSSSEPDMRQLIFKYVEGLQWVLYYYYHGVQSWEWFFPYHYAPKISDLKRISEFQLKFDKGTPFKPFYQLMGVLPTASQSLIPPAFRTLMTDPTSSILHFYPNDFDCDMNGKKADWEAVIKIPFIEESKLIEALEEREKFLTVEEKKRNSFGDSLIFSHDLSSLRVYTSSLPGIFPDISNCTCNIKVYHLPLLGDDGLQHGLCKQVRLGKRLLAGFPSLDTLPHTASLGFHGVNLFNMESKNESMIVTIKNVYENKSPEDIARQLIGNNVWIDWPFLHEAKCVGLADEYFTYTRLSLNDSAVVKTPLTDKQQDMYHESVGRIDKEYSKKKGSVIGPIEFLVLVYPFKGMKLADDGALIKEFDSNMVRAAVQTVVDTVDVADERYLERPAPPLQIDFPINSQVFFLGLSDYGTPAQVAGFTNDKLDLSLIKMSELTLDNSEIKKFVQSLEHLQQYLPSYLVSKSLGMSGLAIARLTSSLHLVRKHTEERVNIGLNLKFDAKQKKVLGYSRKTGNGWEFSQKAVALLIAYKEAFPQVFEHVQRNAKGDFFVDVEIFREDAVHQVQKLLIWLKDQQVKDFDRVSLNTVALESNSIKKLEEFLDSNVKTSTGIPDYSQILVKSVPRQAVLKPLNAPHRLSTQKFELGDRVVHVLTSGSVPLAAKGTVVGVDDSYLDVLFDRTFMGGSDLSNRGSSMKAEALLNLSKPQVNYVPIADNRARPTSAASGMSGPSTQRRADKSLYFKVAEPKQRSPPTKQRPPSASTGTAWRAPVSVASVAQEPPSTPLGKSLTQKNGKQKPSSQTGITSPKGMQIKVLKKQDSSATVDVPKKESDQNGTVDAMTLELKSILHIGSGLESTTPSNLDTGALAGSLKKVNAAQKLLENLGMK